MSKVRWVFVLGTFFLCHAASAREVSEHARKAVDAIRQLREIGMPEFAEDAPGPPPRVPGLLRTLNKELRELIVEYLNDQTRHTVPTDEDVLDELRAAGWEEISSQRWNAYGEIEDIDFELKDGYEPGLLVVRTQLWMPCGSSDPDSAIYVFQGRARKWDLVLATESDFDAVGRRQSSGLDYRISPPDQDKRWFLVVGHVPPSCRRSEPVLRYKALRPSSDPDKPTVLATGRETINENFDPAFRVDAHVGWFAVTLGKKRRLDESLGFEILRYDVGEKGATRSAPLALSADDFLDQWAQLNWEEAKRWSNDSAGLAEWHKKLNELAPGTSEIEAVRLCRGAEEGNQDWLVEMSTDQAPNPSFGAENLYVEIAKRNGIFSVAGVRKKRPAGCAEPNTLAAAVPPTELPYW
jgi:hypothetical protein